MTHYHKAFFLTTIKTSKNIMHEKNLYLGRLQIAFFSVSNEHQEQGAKARNSRLLQV